MTSTLATILTAAGGILAGSSSYHAPRVMRAVKPQPITCYDGITPGNLPVGGGAYLAYVNRGEVEQILARFPDARIVTITTDPLYLAELLDIETGAARPTDFLSWHKMCMTHGIRKPGAYASKDNTDAWNEVDKVPYYNRQSIVADWTGEPHFVDGRAGCQYKNTPGYDVSVLKPKWFG